MVDLKSFSIELFYFSLSACSGSGMSSCSACVAGTYADEEGMSGCLDCERGKGTSLKDVLEGVWPNIRGLM